ncbi:MAG: ABC transporter permease, partial [Hyphomonas sp.]|nr:ABC transporter permease [Hyphomonas sp.]
MMHPVDPGFALEESGEETVLRLSGDWTVATLHNVEREFSALDLPSGAAIDVSGLGHLDTAGAFLIDRLLRTSGAEVPLLIGEHPSAASLIAQVHAVADPVHKPPSPPLGVLDLLERVGRGSADILAETVATLAFLGETVFTIFRLALQPWKMRWTSIVSVMEEAGLNAMPIVAFLSFFVGMVVAYIGATTLS